LKQLQRFIIRLLLFFYLTSSYLSAIHIHADDTIEDADCKVCIVVKNITGLDTTSSDCILSVSFVESNLKVKEERVLPRTTSKGYFSHAPPFVS